MENMDYQDIVTKYKKGSLVISNFRKKLEIAKPLETRPRYRALDIAGQNWYYYACITDLITTTESPKKLESFEKKSKEQLNEYFNNLIESIKKCKAWDFMGIKARDFSKERFENAKLSEKFSILYELNQKYCKFLEFQKLADLRGMFTDKKEEFDDQLVSKMCFVKTMFGCLKSEDVREEFFCFDPKFLHALLRYKKSKNIRLEDYMLEQKDSIRREYKKFEQFFKTEDYRDIIENLLLTSKASKMSKTSIMQIYSQISETEEEQSALHLQMEVLRELEKKCYRMNEVKLEYEKERIKRESKERERKLAEEGRKKADEIRKRQQEAQERIRQARIKAERERQITHSEGYTEELERRIAALQKTPTVKEAVVPVVFIWLDKDQISLTKRFGNQKLATFFAKLKDIEKQTGRRVSLFLVTNADQQTTQKRIEELQNKAKDVGMERLVEGGFGGYSSFRIDEQRNIQEVSQMSPENRKKIKLLLEKFLPRTMIDETEENYIRYKFSDKPDKHIDKTYLSMMVGRMLNDTNVRRQPLKFMTFIERGGTGIDVVLESQLKGISKINEYYESKYDVLPGKSYKVNIEKIEEFLEKKEDTLSK